MYVRSRAEVETELGTCTFRSRSGSVGDNSDLSLFPRASTVESRCEQVQASRGPKGKTQPEKTKSEFYMREKYRDIDKGKDANEVGVTDRAGAGESEKGQWTQEGIGTRARDQKTAPSCGAPDLVW